MRVTEHQRVAFAQNRRHVPTIVPMPVREHYRSAEFIRQFVVLQIERQQRLVVRAIVVAADKVRLSVKALNRFRNGVCVGRKTAEQIAAQSHAVRLLLARNCKRGSVSRHASVEVGKNENFHTASIYRDLVQLYVFDFLFVATLVDDKAVADAHHGIAP